MKTKGLMQNLTKSTCLWRCENVCTFVHDTLTQCFFSTSVLTYCAYLFCEPYFQEVKVLKQVVCNLTEKRRQAKENKKPKASCLKSPRTSSRPTSARKNDMKKQVTQFCDVEKDEYVHQPNPLEIVSTV